MALDLFMAGLAVLIIALMYDYIRTKRESRLVSRKVLESKDKTINHLQENERELRGALQALELKLQDAYLDPVTQLPAWVLFEEKISQSLKEGERFDFAMAIMFVDLDEFSVVNDAMGNEVGDEVLREATRRLQGCIRQVDSLGRFAKDTFVVLLNHLANPGSAAIVSQRMLRAFSEPMTIGGQALYVTVSIGVAMFPMDGKDLQTLMRNADHALHLAKERGKRQCQFYEEQLHNHSQRELLLYNSLNSDTVFDELIIYYQPILNVKSGQVICMESILYWRHPELGLILSQDLFEYAERQNKLNTFSEWLLRKACHQFKSWGEKGLQPPLLGISLAIKQLENSHFIYQLSQIMQELEFDPSRLLVEIKEDFSNVSLEVLEKAFNMLSYLGVKMAITDFGAGSFNLRYLKHFKFDYLKLENTIADDVTMNHRSQSLIKSILALATSLSAEIMLPSVENKQQMYQLQDLGIHLMQGSYFGQPVLDRDVLDNIASYIKIPS